MLALPFAVTACGLSTRQYVERREWPLAVRRPNALAAPAGGPVLLVRDVTPGPLAGNRGLLTIQPDGSVQVGYYEEWAASPADAITASLRAWLAESGLFGAVLDPGSLASPDLVLESTLTAFVADPPAGQARAALAIVLLRERAGNTTVALEKTEAAAAPLAQPGAPAATAALRAALAGVLAATERDLAPFARLRTRRAR